VFPELRSTLSRTPRWAALCLALACGGGEENAEPVEELPEANAAPRAPAETEAEAPEEPAEPPEPSGPPKRIFARRFVVPVRSGPSRDAERIGYLRGGAVLMAKTAEPVGDEGCRGGWYELTTGGYVCNGRMVTAFEGERLPQVRGTQPDRDAPLPYDYGFVRRRVPQYRNLPSDEEAAEYEGYRIPGAEPEAAEGVGGEAATAMGETGMAAAMGETGMAAAMGETGMAATMGETGMAAAAMSESAMAAMAPTMAASAMANAADEAPSRPDEAPGESSEGDEGEEDEGPTLASLQGERGTILMRWLMRGFYVSLDRDFRRGGRRYWRTQANGFVPYNSVMSKSGSEFQGTVLPLPAAVTGGVAAEPEVAEAAEATDEAEATETEAAPVPAHLPYAWTLTSRDPVFTRAENGRFRRARGAADYHHGFPVLEEVEDGRYTYLRGPDDRWHRARDVRVARAVEPPSEVGPEDKWIEVNLETQTLVLYEGRTPVYTTLVSSGLPDRRNLPDRDFETLSGLFRVKSKHLTDTMDGDTAVDGPYSVDDVPYVMYFELAYALHAAFWHNRFGRPKSHGCVNLSPEDARHIFNWADPPLPDGWHSAYPTDEMPGTWVWVHGETVGHTE